MEDNFFPSIKIVHLKYLVSSSLTADGARW